MKLYNVKKSLETIIQIKIKGILSGRLESHIKSIQY